MLTYLLCAALGGLALTGQTPAPAASVPVETMVFATRQPVAFAAMLDDLSQADVVFVGEQHDHKQGHALERDLLQGLSERNPRQTFSLEMFERDVQGVVDEYLDGYITETHFLQSSRPWPNYKDDYRPLIEFCREHKIPVVAANAPRRYVNIVSRKGQEALRELPPAARATLAPLPVSMELPAEYDRQLTELFGGAHDDKAAPANPAMPSADHLKQAQALWDSTMADSVVRALRRRPSRKVMQINGSMHSDSGYGIVDRVRRQLPKAKIRVVTIRPSSAYPGYPAEIDPKVADYVIVTPPEAKKAVP